MTECSRCGNCCERIHFIGSWTKLQEWAEYAASWRAWAMEHLLNGEDGGWDLEQSAKNSIANAEFLLAHWRPIPEDVDRAMPRFSCDAFDSVTRLCTAHEFRPPILQRLSLVRREARPIGVPAGHRPRAAELLVLGRCAARKQAGRWPEAAAGAQWGMTNGWPVRYVACT